MTSFSILVHSLFALSSWSQLLVLLRYPAAASAAGSSGIPVREYCEDEIFVANCSGSHSSLQSSTGSSGGRLVASSADQLVVVDIARYGRMRIERCLMSTYGASSGCSKDILVHLDSLCSGRPHCEFNVRDLLVHNPCQKDLRGYLEAKYHCVKVVAPENPHKCRHRAPVLVTAPSGYLSNYITQQTGCGGIDAPWHIRASPGQKINITLLDFGWNSIDGGPVCQVLAIIKDRIVGHSETICQAKSRISHVHYTLSHDVEIRMLLSSSNRDDHTGRYFLFKYEVEGCADLEVSRDMWFGRLSPGVAEVGCSDRSTVKWRLTCESGRWSGSHGNCSDESSSSSSLTGFIAHGLLHLPVGVNIVIIAAVAGLIGICVLVGGLIVLRRRFSVEKMTNPKNFKDLYIQKSSHGAAGDLCRVQSEEDEGGSTETSRVLPSGLLIQNTGGGLCSTRRSGQNGPGTGINRSSWELKGLRGPPVAPSVTSDLRKSPSLPSYRLQNESPPRYVDHIYESPTSIRKAFGDNLGSWGPARPGPDSLQYYEVYERSTLDGEGATVNGRIAL